MRKLDSDLPEGIPLKNGMEVSPREWAEMVRKDPYIRDELDIDRVGWEMFFVTCLVDKAEFSHPSGVRVTVRWDKDDQEQAAFAAMLLAAVYDSYNRLWPDRAMGVQEFILRIGGVWKEEWDEKKLEG